MHQVIQQALHRYDDFPILNSGEGRIGLLDDYYDNVPVQQSFTGHDVVFVQHHLAEFIPRMPPKLDQGLDPERTWFIDIPYSTSDQVMPRLERMGFDRRKMLPVFDDPLKHYCEVQKDRAAVIFEQLASRQHKQPLLVIDDGAYLLRYLNGLAGKDRRKLEQFNGAAIVEQTTRGHRYIEDECARVIRQCGLKVVSIAKCHTKKAFEGPFIGASSARAFIEGATRGRLQNARQMALIGYGVVGQSTLNQILAIDEAAVIDVIDIDPAARAAIDSMKNNCASRKELNPKGQYDIIFGCTGYSSFKLDQRHCLADHALLVSGSSAAVEFNRNAFVELADEYPDDEIEILNREETIRRGIHAPIDIQYEDQKVMRFMNAGFPINFNGRHETLPRKMIQATHAALAAAAVQAQQQQLAGFNTLDSDVDHWIYESALHDLSIEPAMG